LLILGRFSAGFENFIHCAGNPVVIGGVYFCIIRVHAQKHMIFYLTYVENHKIVW